MASAEWALNTPRRLGFSQKRGLRGFMLSPLGYEGWSLFASALSLLIHLIQMASELAATSKAAAAARESAAPLRKSQSSVSKRKTASVSRHWVLEATAAQS